MMETKYYYTCTCTCMYLLPLSLPLSYSFPPLSVPPSLPFHFFLLSPSLSPFLSPLSLSPSLPLSLSLGSTQRGSVIISRGGRWPCLFRPGASYSEREGARRRGCGSPSSQHRHPELRCLVSIPRHQRH